MTVREVPLVEIERGETATGRKWFRVRHPQWVSGRLWDTESNWEWVEAVFAVYLGGVGSSGSRVDRERARLRVRLEERLRVLDSERAVLLARLAELGAGEAIG